MSVIKASRVLRTDRAAARIMTCPEVESLALAIIPLNAENHCISE